MRRLITFVVCCTALMGCTHNFLSKYQDLEEKDLPNFFADWKAYSDSVSANNVVTDTLLQNIITRESVDLWEADESYDKSRQYRVIPQHIEVERYYFDVDTADISMRWGFPSDFPDMKEDQHRIDTITPALPPNTLYLTPEIEKTLSEFLGGVGNNEKVTPFKIDNILNLQDYIPIHEGHWGGYWWFTSFPLVYRIDYADNLIAVQRRTSWCTGDEIWYVKTDSGFVRCQEPISDWIE